jgi:predicted Fe-S protein YdhL (DUF1289 family)
MNKKQQASQSDINSPCVRNCCLNEEDICLGCFRHLNEITGWAAMTDSEKQQVLTNCELRSKQIKHL